MLLRWAEVGLKSIGYQLWLLVTWQRYFPALGNSADCWCYDVKHHGRLSKVAQNEMSEETGSTGATNVVCPSSRMIIQQCLSAKLEVRLAAADTDAEFVQVAYRIDLVWCKYYAILYYLWILKTTVVICEWCVIADKQRNGNIRLLPAGCNSRNCLQNGFVFKYLYLFCLHFSDE